MVMVVSSEDRFLTFSISVACNSSSLFTLPALGDSRLTALVVERGSVGSGGLGTGLENHQPIFVLFQAQKGGGSRGSPLSRAGISFRESLHSPMLKYGSYGSRDLKFVPYCPRRAAAYWPCVCASRNHPLVRTTKD